jgi:uncharacterized damage-inducible protein DinB
MQMPCDLLLDLFDHMESADAAIWTEVLKHETAREDAQLRRYLLHMHTVQRAFLNAWTSQPVAFRQDFDDTTIAAELDDVRSYYAVARAFIAAQDETALGERMILPWEAWVEQYLKRPPSPTRLGETILQVISHTTHHRAQVSARLRALGGEPPPVDYIAWLWLGRPQPEWPAGEADTVRSTVGV